MAVGRMINRTIALDRELNLASIEAQLLYVMTIPHLDRDGLIIGEVLPHLGAVLPLRPEFFARYDELVEELVGCGLVLRYPTRKGRVLFFPGFRKNQNFIYSREAASVFDPPPGYVRTGAGLDRDELASNSGVDREQNTLKLSKDKISQTVGEAVAAWEAGGLTLNPIMLDEIKASVDEWAERGHPEYVVDAIRLAIKANVRRWTYVEGILRRCADQGTSPLNGNGPGDKSKKADQLEVTHIIDLHTGKVVPV